MEHKVLDLMMENKDYFEDFITRSVNTSNRIEGSTLSYVETYAILWNDNSFNLKNIKPRDFYEAVNLKYASNVMLGAIKNKEPLTEELIIRLNETINKNVLDTTGYRKVQVYIRGAKEIPPSAMEVREKMMYLVEDFNHNMQIPLLEKIAQFHIMFEHIHPFEDGNGRTGRLLLNFELIKQEQAPIIIPDERRVEYFNYISEYDIKGFTEMLKELQIQEMERMKQFRLIHKQEKK